MSTSAQPTRKPWISLQVERFEADAPVKPTRAPRIAPSNLKREGKKTADLRTLPTLGTALEHTVPTQRFTQTGPGVSTLAISNTTAWTAQGGALRKWSKVTSALPLCVPGILPEPHHIGIGALLGQVEVKLAAGGKE